MDNNLRNFGFGLKRARKKAGFTSQKLLAEELKKAGLSVTVDTIENWEQGKSFPVMENFLKLCDFFDCSADYLLGLIDEKTIDDHYVCEYTGLSENALNSIKNNCLAWELSGMLTTKSFIQIISNLDYFRGSFNRNITFIDYLSSVTKTKDINDDDYEIIDQFLTWFPELRMQLFEFSEMWSNFMEEYFPHKDLIAEGKRLYDEYND